MFKMKLRFFFSIVLLSFFVNLRSQTLIINEVSNGNQAASGGGSGEREYVELLVVEKVVVDLYHPGKVVLSVQEVIFVVPKFCE